VESTEKTICLTTERELRIFMDPLRQRILACMELAGTPMTAKKLADTLGIAPSSAKHHLGRLESIGVVLRDHQETIRGIVATFYRMTEKEVAFDGVREGLWDQQRLLLENRSRMVQSGFDRAMTRDAEILRRLPEDQRALWRASHGLGTRFEAGVLHLTPEQLRQMDGLIRMWTAANRSPAPGTVPVRYCLVSYEAANDRE